MNYLKKKKSLIASYSNFKEYLKHKVVCFYISQESELKRGTAHVGISIIYKQYIYIYFPKSQLKYWLSCENNCVFFLVFFL